MLPRIFPTFTIILLIIWVSDHRCSTQDENVVSENDTTVLQSDTTASPFQQQNCSVTMEEMDEAVAKVLLVTDPNLKPFNSSEDFKINYCE